jgi:hypothetical protein
MTQISRRYVGIDLHRRRFGDRADDRRQLDARIGTRYGTVVGPKPRRIRS